jgi:hypothetical protein
MLDYFRANHIIKQIKAEIKETTAIMINLEK